MAPASLCPVCASGIERHVGNAALGELGEGVWAASGIVEGTPVAACDACSREAAADAGAAVLHGTHTCSACTQVLCNVHAEAHSRLRAGHAVIASSGTGRVGTHCPVHPATPLTHVCMTDKAVVCALCALRHHSGHVCLELAEAAPAVSGDDKSV